MVFLRNYRFDFLHDGLHQQPYTYRKQFGWKLSQLAQLHQNLATPETKKFLLELLPNLTLHFNHRVNFLCKSLNWTPHSGEGRIICIKILIVQNFQETILKMSDLDHWKSVSL